MKSLCLLAFLACAPLAHAQTPGPNEPAAITTPACQDLGCVYERRRKECDQHRYDMVGLQAMAACLYAPLPDLPAARCQPGKDQSAGPEPANISPNRGDLR